MGRYINTDEPLSDEDKQFLQSRGRQNEVDENVRRFGHDGNGGEAAVNPEFEGAGGPAESTSFDPEERAAATHDVGGAPLPGTFLERDTGRVVPLKPRSEGFDNIDPNTGEVVQDPDHFDEDIIEEVEQIETVKLLKERLVHEKIDFEGKTSKEDLQDALIIGLQDKRNALGGDPEAIATDAADGSFVDPAKGETL